MPYIPQYVSHKQMTTDVPAVTKSARLEAQSGLGGILGSAGDILAKVNAKMKEIDNYNQESEFKADVARRKAELTDNINKFANDPETLDIADRGIEGGLAKIWDEASQRITDPQLKNKLKLDYDLDSVAYTIDRKTEINKKKVGRVKVNIFKEADVLLSDYIDAQTPKEMEEAKKNIENIFAQGTSLGVFNREEAYRQAKMILSNGDKIRQDKKKLLARQEKELVWAQEQAKNKRENEFMQMKISGVDKLGTPISSEELIKMARNESQGDNPLISPRFADRYINALTSPKEITKAKIKKQEERSKTFTKLAKYINTGSDSKQIKLEILNENSIGNLTDDEARILFVFNQAMTPPKKNFLEWITFWSEEHPKIEPEIRISMFKNYMNRVNNGETPENAAVSVVKETIKTEHPAVAMLEDTPNAIMKANTDLEDMGVETTLKPEITIDKQPTDEFGFIIGEVRKGHEYVGNNEWKKIAQ